jgi:Domain of unknown function (DUF4145)
MDRTALKIPFTIKKPNDWGCPTCHNGLLRIKEDTFHNNEIRESRDHHSYDHWDPECIQYVFSCMLVCKNDQCKETVSCIGVGGVESNITYDVNDEPDHSYDEFFLPKYFEPHLRLINIPEKCPESVSKPLKESFGLFFSSPSAASNNVRMAIEELLTELKVRRFNLVKNERRFMSLNQRINLLPLKFSQLKDLILAIKWLGNAGSHASGKVSMDDVMDSYDLIEHVLHEIYAPKTKKLAALAKQINKKEGPLKRKTKLSF